MRVKFINWLIKILKVNTNEISDGHHTYIELYEHRILLFILLMKYAKKIGMEVWYSNKHSDGTNWNGWIICGIGKEKGKQITYHVVDYCINMLDFAEKLDKAPEWDGHTSNDVLSRLTNLINKNQ